MIALDLILVSFFLSHHAKCISGGKRGNTLNKQGKIKLSFFLPLTKGLSVYLLNWWWLWIGNCTMGRVTDSLGFSPPHHPYISALSFCALW